MEFIVNEQGCQVLSQEMYNGLDQISNLISELESMDGTLRNALGDDYESIGKNINEMKSEFENALREFRVIVEEMNEYMNKVHQIKVVMYNGD